MNNSARPATTVCPHCQATNRVGAGAVAQAHCGRCGQLLYTGHPLALDSSTFECHAANADTPLVVDFWAPWCGPCRGFAPVFERAARELEPAMRFAKVNTDEAVDLATRHAIRSIPTLAIFRGGREIARATGAMDYARFTAWLRQSTPA
ncbi:MAG: thioredoxin [Pseudomonadota bacterium]|jgi:thioredoxin 2